MKNAKDLEFKVCLMDGKTMVFTATWARIEPSGALIVFKDLYDEQNNKTSQAVFCAHSSWWAFYYAGEVKILSGVK